MTCESCGDKPKNTAKDFTKAVIEIDNPETLTLFHKVVIPASMGDETTVPPAIGKYHNVLLLYEASGNAYLYSSDGMPTRVTVPGVPGPQGAPGKDGKDGVDGKDGKDGTDGTDGRDGVIQYTAGTGISISSSNVISATGSAVATWGDITGTLSNQTDLQDALNAKQATLTAGSNISIAADNTISATDTTYSNFTGTDGVSAGTAGLVPAPTTSDTDKFLKSDGTWSVTGSGNTNITMTTVDPGEGSPLAADHFIGVYGGDPLVMDYSTSEVNTGMKWVDGSTIYKKTVDTGALPNSANKSVPHGITNLHRVIKLEGYAYYPNTPTSYPLPFPSHIAVGNVIDITVDATNIVLSTGVDRSNLTESYVTIYYTKSA